MYSTQTLRIGPMSQKRFTRGWSPKLIDKGKARQYAADLLSVSRSTLYRALDA
jgi:hypothetical protein